jgi:thiol:disulfide interchange protein DsbD
MNLMIKQFFVFVLLVSALVIGPANAQKSLFDSSSSSLMNKVDDDFIDVDQAFKFDFSEQGSVITVNFDIADGYYLYKKRFKVKSKNAIVKPVQYPEGLPHEDEFFGAQQIYKQHVSFQVFVEQADKNAEISIRYQGCAEKGLCYPPQTKKIQIAATAAASSVSNSVLSALSTNGGANNSSSVPVSTNTNNVKNAPVTEQNKLASMLKQDSLWLTLVAFFVGGLLLSFTPCVFPMYPILTGIIVGQGKQLTTKKAFSLSFVYVQGMAVTYTILGIVVALAGAQFQAMFQHPIVLIALSVLFVFLAFSMFGFFNLALPASWQSKLNNISNKQQGGSYLGVMSMGIISGLVASPCTTAPLTGALLYISQTGDLVLGASALYALSLGMGVPLLILGSSGGKLLPKAGAWMNIIKNVFGFLLLAVPVFLLQRIVPDSVVQYLWVALVLSTAIYFYVVNLPSKQGFWFGVRSLIIFVVLMFASIHLYFLVMGKPSLTSNADAMIVSKAENKFIKVANLTELNAQVKKANEQGKTVMVDLYADWCVACKEFEHLTFNQPQVIDALANSVLLQIDLTDTGSESSVEIMQTFEVFGLPSILFFDKQGKELSLQRVTGFMDADAFSQHINTIFQ